MSEKRKVMVHITVELADGDTRHPDEVADAMAGLDLGATVVGVMAEEVDEF